MEEISVSKAKATLLAVVKKVERTGKPVRLTKHGKAVVEIVPSRTNTKARELGTMAGTVEVHGDIVGSIVSQDEWDVFRQ
jgi:prevent-host-death family protein